ncbi:MAG: sigma-70 family RNA polymerase sigma factor [Candidatus Promineifilaceae bacterium]|jgi:RNA polymerase sigma-70 factor (ECF subfamily)
MMTSVTASLTGSWDTLNKRKKEQVPVVNESEIERLKRARALDRDTLGAIYDDYHPLVYRYICRRVGDVEAAQDLAAEVFRRFLQALHKGSGPSDNLRAWLFRAAHNIVIDHYRRRNKLEHLPIDESLAGDNPDPGQRTETNLQIDRVRSALGQLTPDQQHVLALKFLEGLSNHEVAEITGKSVGAVKSLQHRALAALQRQLVQVEEEAQS